MHVVIIDNFDSFTHNLADLVRKTRHAHSLKVIRNDEVSVDDLVRQRPSHIILSPGPGDHTAGGISHEILASLAKRVPTLGVCLGHQLIAYAAGAKVVRAPRPVHGHSFEIFHDQTSVFTQVPSPFVACRYHSLVVDEETLPSELEVTARSKDLLIMALRHKQYPQVGVQFHPESFLTENGLQIMSNFLSM